MPKEGKFSQALPRNWDGRFPFSNDSKEDFVFQWNKKRYLFPAHKTVDMCRMILDATPLEIQQIRKFAARQFAEREFFKSQKYASLRASEGTRDENGVITPRLQSFQAARSYTDADLAEFVQKCLRPFEEATASISEAEDIKTEDKLHRDEETGEFISTPVKNSAKSLDPSGILLK